MLKSHGVDPPSRDYEDKYHKDNEGITYICVGYDLVAMFVLEYNPNRRLLNSLKSAGKNNIKIFIRTYDSNINMERISKDFAVSLEDLSIAPLEDSLGEKNIRTQTECFECMNKSDKLIDGVVASKRLKANFKLVFAINLLSLMLGLIIVATVAFNGTLHQISEYEILIYNLFWLLSSVVCG